jgi:hypothetical protein
MDPTAGSVQPTDAHTIRLPSSYYRLKASRETPYSAAFGSRTTTAYEPVFPNQ